MKRARITLAAIVMMAPAFLAAQPSTIKIKQGQHVEYDITAELEVTEILGDREAVLRASTGGVAQLKARRISRGKIEWTYETPEVRLVRVGGTGDPGEFDEAVIQAKTGRVATDPRGRVVSGLKAGDSKSLTPMTEAMHRAVVKLWFQPALLRGKHPGDVWSEKRDERLLVAEMGIDLRTRYDVGYRFDGIVDTLGTKAVRITWSAPRMTIDGNRTIDGVRSPISGDGDLTGTSYFSTIDGLLLASVSESTLDIRMSPTDGRGGVIPITWRMRSESLRR